MCLTSLNLGFTDLGPGGAKFIASSLATHQSIIKLKLARDNISNVGVSHLGMMTTVA